MSEILKYGYFANQEKNRNEETQPILTPIENQEEEKEDTSFSSGYFKRVENSTSEELTPTNVPVEQEVQSETPLSFGYFAQQQKPDISFSREFAYGVAQEPTALGSLFRIGKAAVQSGFDINEDYEEARSRIEKERQVKIREEFPEFTGREETIGVMAGRAGLALADPATFFMPWVKIAKAGKVASIGAAGVFGATDLALREEALYGEVRPEVVALGFGAGLAGGAIGEAGIALYNKAINTKVKVSNSIGTSIEKEIKIPGPTKLSDIDIGNAEALEQVGKQTFLQTQEATNNVGFVNLKIREIETRKFEIKEQIAKLNANTKRLTKKPLNTEMVWDMDYNTYSKLMNNPLEVRKLKAERTELTKKITNFNQDLERIYIEEIPTNMLEVYSKSMINANEKGILNEGLARALTQELTKPILGGLIGGGIGASFTDEEQGNGLMITYAVMGATLGKFQKMIQSKPFTLIPKTARDGANEEFIAGFRRAWFNQLKSFAAGSHVQDLMGWSVEVANKFGTRMYQPFGGGIALGKTSPVNPVEVEAMDQLAKWGDRAAELFSKHDDDVLILAGKIRNEEGLVSEKYSFLTAEDKLNVNYPRAEILAKDIEILNNDFASYMNVRGIAYKEEDAYGITQILDVEKVTPGNYAQIIKDLSNAFGVQNKNIAKILTPAQLKDKEFLRNTYPTFGKDTKKIAASYLETSSSLRNNSIFSDKEDVLFKTNNNAGDKFKEFKSRDEDFILQAAKHFDKDRTLFDQEARASVSDLFEKNPRETTEVLFRNSIHVAEFAKQFGAKGEYIKEIFMDINNRYFNTINKSIVNKTKNPDDAFKTVQDLFDARPGVKKAAEAEKKKIKDSLEAYFGVYHINRMPTGDAARAFATFLQTGLATTRLTFVALPSMGDWLQTFNNSGYKASSKSLVAQVKKIAGKADPLSKEGLALGRQRKQIKGKDVTYTDRILGNHITSNELSRELSDVLLIGDTLGMKQYQKRMSDFTRKFFEVVQLGRVTRTARNFAYDAGVFRAMDIANLIGRGKTKQFLKSEDALLKEMGDLGLTKENFKYLSQFKKIEDALMDDTAKMFLKKAGIRSANRDAIIPMVGNRRLFTQSKDPYIKFLGSFMSWAQAKTSQTNGLIARVEQGDVALFLRVVASIPIFASIREVQVMLSPNEKYKEGVNDETLKEKVGEALAYSGLNTYLIEKIRSIFKYLDYGSSPIEQIAPVLGYASDLIEIATKPDFVPEEDETMMEAFIEGLGTVVKETAEVLPILEEISPRVINLLEKEDEKLGFVVGGLVEGEDTVPYTKENPANRVNPYTGEPYQEEMNRLGFDKGGEASGPPKFEKRIARPDPDMFIKDPQSGNPQTHRMGWGDIEGQFIAYPTIVEQDGKLVQYENNTATMKLMKKNGNFKAFDTKEKAQAYAEGSWKTKEFNEVYN